MVRALSPLGTRPARTTRALSERGSGIPRMASSSSSPARPDISVSTLWRGLRLELSRMVFSSATSALLSLSTSLTRPTGNASRVRSASSARKEMMRLSCGSVVRSGLWTRMESTASTIARQGTGSTTSQSSCRNASSVRRVRSAFWTTARCARSVLRERSRQLTAVTFARLARPARTATLSEPSLGQPAGRARSAPPQRMGPPRRLSTSVLAMTSTTRPRTRAKISSARCAPWGQLAQMAAALSACPGSSATGTRSLQRPRATGRALTVESTS
mmetsp:Transcript_46418/g.109024  ORF Transcript_46418/g.109024 Transcript_46418/m.109024 type:complete len:273 (-) Transcript_46418:1339-2157(-)